MVSRTEGEQKLDSHAIHVRHGQYAQRLAELRHVDAQVVDAEIHIAPQCTIRQHYALRETCRSRGVVDHRQFLRRVLIPMNIVFAEGIRIFFAEHFI